MEGRGLRHSAIILCLAALVVTIAIPKTAAAQQRQITGTAQDDRLELLLTKNGCRLKLNEQRLRCAASGRLIINGDAGSDALVVRGSKAKEKFYISQTKFEVHTEGKGRAPLALVLKGIELVTAHSGGRKDEANLYAGAKRDVLVARPGFAEMRTQEGGAAPIIRTESFRTLEAFSTPQQDDVAFLYDSPGDDSYREGNGQVRLSGKDFSLVVSGFKTSYAYSLSGGNDSAELAERSPVSCTDTQCTAADSEAVRHLVYDFKVQGKQIQLRPATPAEAEEAIANYLARVGHPKPPADAAALGAELSLQSLSASGAQDAASFGCGETLTDARDGKSYRTVRIGEQCWMAENLNVGTAISPANMQGASCSAIQKYCHQGCDEYGGLYSWQQAVCGNRTGGRIQGICPEGWYLPTSMDVLTLLTAVGSKPQRRWSYATNSWVWFAANGGSALKSPTGFDARYGGYYLRTLSYSVAPPFFGIGTQGNFWTASETHYLNVGIQFTSAWVYSTELRYGLSVRCFRPDPTILTILNPSGMPRWFESEPAAIEWESSNHIGQVSITLWQDGIQQSVIAENLPSLPGRNSYSWTIPPLTSGTYQIRVADTGTTAKVSSADVIIVKPLVCGNGRMEGSEECDDGNSSDTDACSNDCKIAFCGDGRVQLTEQCDDGNTADSDACDNSCRLPVCGDGRTAGSEECDDGNNINTDSCTMACKTAACGDGYKQAGEQCDDGNQVNTDQCTASCRNPVCGDGYKQAGEQCDDANQLNTDSCTNSCRIAFCGDGYKQGSEQCDDGNRINNDGCSNLCTLPYCGDAIIQYPEQCDDGNQTNTDACTAVCKYAACGDGYKQLSEQCDDGNRLDGDSCSSLCRLPVCGDGIVQAPEECDDANFSNRDSCRNDCKRPICGDGYLQTGEQCDDGNLNNSDNCTATCKMAFCGDGILRAGEECDDGNQSNADSCTIWCRVARCGDGVTGPGEECDDANLDNTDACTTSCKTAYCGDGFLQRSRGEFCDDGNQSNNDSCTNWCNGPVCGDGFVQQGEECDDKNLSNTDGCTNYCKLPACGDGILQSGEECDDKNTIEWDGCTNSCTLPVCGDGFMQRGEMCDEGPLNGTPDHCNTSCTGIISPRLASTLRRVDVTRRGALVDPAVSGTRLYTNDILTYEVTVTNVSTIATARNVTTNSFIAGNLAFEGGLSDGCRYENQRVLCSVSTLAPGAAVTKRWQVKILRSATGICQYSFRPSVLITSGNAPSVGTWAATETVSGCGS